MECSLVKVPLTNGAKKKNESMKFCQLAGLTMIELGHAMGSNDHSYTVKGFQGGVIKYVPSNKAGTRPYQIFLSKLPTGEDCAYGNGLEFKPDRDAGNILQGMMIRTEYNMDFLAKHVFSKNGKRTFFPIDPSIEDEIKKIALANGYDKNVPVAPKKVLITANQTIVGKDIRIKELEEMLKNQEELTAAIKSETESEEDIFNAIRDEVEESEKVRIDTIKKKARNFRVTNEYKSKILPIIEAKVSERATVGV